MDLNFDKNKIKVYLPESMDDVQPLRNHLEIVMHQANLKVYRAEQNEIDLEEADCSVHILGNKFDTNTETPSVVQQRFLQARKFNEKNENFRIFIWQPAQFLAKENAPKQEQFINSIRNKIYRNMVFSNHESPILLVEDMRSIIYTEQKTNFKVNDTEVFFIYNEIDEDSALEIVDLLADVVKVQKLSIILNSATDYSELIAQQIQRCIVPVIYFKRTSGWAVPFTQQVWKKIGGASANKTIHLIGDANIEKNRQLKLSIPNVVTSFESEELIPLEIKVLIDNLKNTL